MCRAGHVTGCMTTFQHVWKTRTPKVPLASLISRSRRWFALWPSSGRNRETLSLWHAARNDLANNWRVIDGASHEVVARDCTEGDARAIADDHNDRERDRWLWWHRC